MSSSTRRRSCMIPLITSGTTVALAVAGPSGAGPDSQTARRVSFAKQNLSPRPLLLFHYVSPCWWPHRKLQASCNHMMLEISDPRVAAEAGCEPDRTALNFSQLGQGNGDVGPETLNPEAAMFPQPSQSRFETVPWTSFGPGSSSREFGHMQMSNDLLYILYCSYYTNTIR